MNEPAFPQKNIKGNWGLGLTMRDYFAAKAVQGMFASDTSDWNQEGEWEERAQTAYTMADAMLEARDK